MTSLLYRQTQKYWARSYLTRAWGKGTIASIGLRKLKALGGLPSNLGPKSSWEDAVAAELKKRDVQVTVDDIIKAFESGEEVCLDAPLQERHQN